ncbi:MAG: HD domain-containing protein [Humidesulfovibrio sp.]|uniref:[protein-PII] uridylyltransferase family protein n=1 Tax=Humidesulfovibrio sp. TaxID=2910988 RepID=UPI0027E98C0D|nr:nucleotidyltransferase domain-containing protein [Humidesulfovibrio sp.]MDQ7835381.1 HD domain-containing protein [Humidesulfovibrio sp.]
MTRETDSEQTGPVLPPSAIALRQGRSSLAEAARAGDLAGYPAAAAALMDAYFRARLAELPQAPATSPPFALVAVGGYGRGELCPASDVDVLVLYEGAVPPSAEELSRGLFHPLWDIGLDLGHGVRALADGLALAREDTQVLTSLLDIRLISGSESVVARFRQEFSQKVLAQAAEPFGQWVLAHNAQRRAEYGDSSGLLEPELKNGLGALRDVHQIHWLLGLRPEAAEPFTPGDRAVLEEDYAFVLAARTALHLAARRKTDRLSFDYQPQVARALGFAGADPVPDNAGEHVEGDQPDPYATGLAVEAFLSRLHQSMTRIRSMRQACWLNAFPPKDHTPSLPSGAPEGIVDTPTGVAFKPGLEPSPAQILALYVAAAQASRPVAWPALRATRLALADEPTRAAFASLPGILDALIAIFRVCGRDAESSPLSLAAGKAKAQKGLVRALKGFFAPAKAPGEAPEPPPPPTIPTLSTALQSMLDTGLLAALVPEFGPVEHLVQFDDFHIHPVGKHTLEVVRTLAAMPDTDLNGGDAWLAERARAIPHFERLLLAGFAHDLAKPDRDHSGAGARMATGLLRRLGADKDTVEDVAFLVREHLLIPKTATRRDLADESVSARLAEVCATPERLDMLHLLAVADSSSTGPRAWNPWTASLFSELTLKARHLLTSGPLAEPHAVEKSRKAREAALELAAKAVAGAAPLGRDYAEACLERMPARATLVLDAPTLVRHMELARRFRASLDEDLVRKPSGKAGIGVVEIEAVPLPGAKAFQVSLAALNQPGLFAVMAGVLALHDLNILSAEVLTWNSLPPTTAANFGSGSMALDMFVVQEPEEGLYLDDLWQRIRRAVSYTLLGKLELEYRLEQKRISPLTLPSRAPKARRKVRVDFEASDFYTLVEIAAPDRLGLLHDLARALASLRLEIHVARIATSAGRIHDSFYLRGEGGQRITDPAQAEEIKKALLSVSK